VKVEVTVGGTGVKVEVGGTAVLVDVFVDVGGTGVLVLVDVAVKVNVELAGTIDAPDPTYKPPPIESDGDPESVKVELAAR